jgi:uncharacterized membrane protein YhaH (DUF805 family)
MKEIFSIYWDVLKTKYAKFNGRAGRKEFWYFTLVNVVIYLIFHSFLSFHIYRLYCTPHYTPTINDVEIMMLFSYVFVLIYMVAFFIPSVAVGVRRLHDIGKPGWFYFLVLIPIIGWLVLLYFFVLDSQPGENQFGPNPKGV